jgi:hypothetical protein
MKAIIISLLLLTATKPSFAQNCSTIKKGYAYYNVSMPGAQMADENGNPIPPKPNITRFIYLEYSGKEIPAVTAVLYNGSPLSFSAVPVKEKTVSIGDKKLNHNNSIAVKSGNRFLKIDIAAEGAKKFPETGCKNIVLKLKRTNDTCSFRLIKEAEFFSLPNY